MDGQRLGLLVLHQAEDCAQGADHDAEIHERHAGNSAQTLELHLRQVGDIDIRFARVSPG